MQPSVVTPFSDLIASPSLPRLLQLDTSKLPDTWPIFCHKQKIRIFGILMHENAIGNQKLWAAAGIIAAGFRKGLHLGTNTIIDSTSGNYGEALAYVVLEARRQYPDFPITRVVAVVPENLPEGKKALLVTQGIELVFAKNSLQAMHRARELADRHGYWYTEQYWNSENSRSYYPVGRHLAQMLPFIGAIACGIGSGGSFSGVVASLQDELGERCGRRLHRIAVAVEPGSKVPGVRDPISLEPGTLPWRELADDVRYFGSDAALKFSHALWRQEGCIAGPSSGFAVAGGLLSLHVLWLLQRLDPLRDPDGFVELAVLFPDTRKPYRLEYVEAGCALPNEEE